MPNKKNNRKPRKRPKTKQARIERTAWEITTEPIIHPSVKRLSRKVQETIEEFYYRAQSQPREAIPELIEFIEKYPDVPMLYNYLGVAYSATGQIEKSIETIKKNYQRNPQYLFGRLNYAELCLKKKEYDKIPEIFDHKLDLALLYPKRKRFHISEVTGFLGLVGIYYVEIGERQGATVYYDALRQIAPDFPMTKILGRKLYPGLLKRIWMRMTGKSSSR